MEQLERELARLEKEVKELDEMSDYDKEAQQKVVDYINKYQRDLPNLRAWKENFKPSEEIYAFPVNDEGYPMTELLQLFDRAINSTGLQPASGGHLGYIPGGGVPMAAYGDLLGALTNKYSGIYYGNPGAIRLENLLIDWTAKQFGFEDGYGGNLTSGGSIANLIAVVSARDAHEIKGKDFEKTVIYGSAQMHHSLHKAIRIAGLGECVLRDVPLDKNWHLDTGKLKKQIKKDKKNGLNPFMIIASSGTTDTGVIDDLDAIADIAEKYNCWFHVDGAYGGYFYLLEMMKNKFKGIERVDSLVIDPHKGLFLPYGTGMVLVRNRGHMLKSHYYLANYMQDAYEAPEEWSPADVSPELSRNFRGLRMWLPLMYHGIKPFKLALREKYFLTQYAYERLKQVENIEVGPEHELSIQTFRATKTGNSIEQDNQLNKELIDRLHKDGRIFISSTSINGVFTLRLAILSFRTHKKEVDTILTMIKEHLNMLIEN